MPVPMPVPVQFPVYGMFPVNVNAMPALPMGGLPPAVRAGAGCGGAVPFSPGGQPGGHSAAYREFSFLIDDASAFPGATVLNVRASGKLLRTHCHKMTTCIDMTGTPRLTITAHVDSLVDLRLGRGTHNCPMDLDISFHAPADAKFASRNDHATRMQGNYRAVCMASKRNLRGERHGRFLETKDLLPFHRRAYASVRTPFNVVPRRSVHSGLVSQDATAEVESYMGTPERGVYTQHCSHRVYALPMSQAPRGTASGCIPQFCMALSLFPGYEHRDFSRDREQRAPGGQEGEQDQVSAMVTFFPPSMFGTVHGVQVEVVFVSDPPATRRC